MKFEDLFTPVPKQIRTTHDLRNMRNIGNPTLTLREKNHLPICDDTNSTRIGQKVEVQRSACSARVVSPSSHVAIEPPTGRERHQTPAPAGYCPACWQYGRAMAVRTDCPACAKRAAVAMPPPGGQQVNFILKDFPMKSPNSTTFSMRALRPSLPF